MRPETAHTNTNTAGNQQSTDYKFLRCVNHAKLICLCAIAGVQKAQACG